MRADLLSVALYKCSDLTFLGTPGVILASLQPSLTADETERRRRESDWPKVARAAGAGAGTGI